MLNIPSLMRQNELLSKKFTLKLLQLKVTTHGFEKIAGLAKDKNYPEEAIAIFDGSLIKAFKQISKAFYVTDLNAIYIDEDLEKLANNTLITIHSTYQKAHNDLKDHISITSDPSELVVLLENFYRKLFDSWRTSSLPITHRLKFEIRDTLSPK